MMFLTHQGVLRRVRDGNHAGLSGGSRSAQHRQGAVLHHLEARLGGACCGERQRVYACACAAEGAPLSVPVLLRFGCLTWAQVSTANAGFSKPSELSFRQTASYSVLTVVRPLAHPTHPILAHGTTAMAFATGEWSMEAPLQQHLGNRGVSVSVHASECACEGVRVYVLFVCMGVWMWAWLCRVSFASAHSCALV